MLWKRWGISLHEENWEVELLVGSNMRSMPGCLAGTTLNRKCLDSTLHLRIQGFGFVWHCRAVYSTAATLLFNQCELAPRTKFTLKRTLMSFNVELSAVQPVIAKSRHIEAKSSSHYLDKADL